MSEKFQGLSIVAKLIVILLIPVMFFTYVGHDPLKQEITNSRNIALVNEDDGADFQDQFLTLGKSVASVVDKDSAYEWSVVSRGTAENGLKNKQYDAVIYLPSSFTRSVLTFNEDEPQKAAINYKIQPNLNAENAEKVQKELQIAKNTINSRVSTVYWGYVSQSMEDIRKKFDSVLEKEIAFQQTMYDFYTPSSKSLSGEIESQKKMLEGILSTTNSAGETSDRSLQELDGTKAQIETFITSVNKFREYQENQVQLMTETSEENQKLLQDSVTRYDTVIKNGIDMVNMKEFQEIPEFQEKSKEMYENVVTIQKQLDENSGKLKDLTQSINSSNSNEQFERLMKLQQNNMKAYKERTTNATLNIVQPSLLSLRQKIQNPSGAGVAGKKTDVKLPANSSGSVNIQNVKKQLAQLKNVAASTEVTDPTVQEKLNSSIATLEESLNTLEKQLQDQNSSQQQWEKAVADAVKDNNSTIEEPVTIAEDKTVEKIKAKEQEVLASPSLTAERKAALSPAFSTTIASKNMEDLLQYYYYLSVFSGELNHSSVNDDSMIEDIIVNNDQYNTIMDAFQKVKAETQLFYQLQGTMDDSVKSMGEFEEDFYTFAEGISTFVIEFETQFGNVHSEIMTELFTIEESAKSISENLMNNTQTPPIEPAPVDNLNGEFIISVQDGSAATLQGISSMVGSIAEQQGNITNYTDELQNKVGSVQQKADELNNKWAQNVGTTKNIKNDVYGLLNNTIVDGQQNPFMYDYLANPVQISGENFTKEIAPTPPVIMLVIILISGLIIGIFLHHFSGAKLMLHIPLFLLLTVTVGLIISIYGLNIYPMHDNQAVKWSILTVVLLIASTSLVRLAFFIGPFIGSLLTIVLIVYFTSPLLDLILPNFSVEHPLANVFLTIQQGRSDGFIPTLIVLGIMAVIFSLIPYVNHAQSTVHSQEATNEA